MKTNRKNRIKRNVTLKDVAQDAGVSVKTVSNVVNNWPYVSDELRQKVLETIDRLGYRPSRVAQSLVTGKTKTIGIVLPDISNPFFGMAIRGYEDIFSQAGYNLFLCNTDENSEKETNTLETLLGRGVDAIMLWGSQTCGEDLYNLVEELPIVSIDCNISESRTNSTAILVDNEKGGEIATSHLIKNNRLPIAHLSGPSHRYTAMLRLAGYHRAIENANIQINRNLILEGQPSIQGGYRSAIKLFQSGIPGSIFCYNDLMAIGAMMAAEEYGLRVPNEIAIVGFDDVFLSSLVTPSLTTIRIDQYQLGKMAGLMLLERINNPLLENKEIMFPIELQIRESSVLKTFSKEEKRQNLEKLVAMISQDKYSSYHK